MAWADLSVKWKTTSAKNTAVEEYKAWAKGLAQDFFGTNQSRQAMAFAA